MEPFTQKWGLIATLEHVPEGLEFRYTDFPQHITLAGVFASELSGKELTETIGDLLSGVSTFEVEGESDQYLGPDKDIAVTIIKTSESLSNLYTLIYSHLIDLGAVYNTPHYEGAGYLAHSTHQKTGLLAVGEKCILNSVSLIDLYPNGDGYQRKIVKTFQLIDGKDS